MTKLSAAEFMGPTVEVIESSKCIIDDDGLIPLQKKPPKCKVRCKGQFKGRDFWSGPKKPLQCVCKDNDNNDGRICVWKFLENEPHKIFDSKFSLIQNTDKKCQGTT